MQAESLSTEIANFKSYAVRQLIDNLKECSAERLLKQMAFFRKAHKRDRDYQCWDEDSHPQFNENEQGLRQKLDYIHFNPVKSGFVKLAFDGHQYNQLSAVQTVVDVFEGQISPLKWKSG